MKDLIYPALSLSGVINIGFKIAAADELEQYGWFAGQLVCAIVFLCWLKDAIEQAEKENE